MKAEALKWDVNRDVELKQNYLDHMLNWEGLLEEQKQKMIKFDRGSAIKGIRVTSRCTNISYLKDFAIFVKRPFEQVTRSDIEQYFYDLINKKLSQVTIRNRKIVVKQFYHWLCGSKKG